MTLEEVLDLMDHEVWVRVRPHRRDPPDEAVLPDVVVWSADWIMQKYLPDELGQYLRWGADDISVEMHDDPELRGTPGPKDRVPMLVVNAYEG